MSDLAREDDERLIKEPEIKERSGLSYTTRWRRRREGRFPDYVAGRYHTLGQIRKWLAEECARAEARSKAYVAEPVTRRGRRSKVA